MFSRRDRVELAVLGLVALGWALVAAPVLHTVEHAHGHRHHHGAPGDTAPHGDGSFEHQHVLFVEAPMAPVLVAQWQPLARVEPSRPEAPSLQASFRPERPQGP
jgi:hypothetical protein